MYSALFSAACYAADSCHGRLKRCEVICSVISGGARVFACALQFLSVHRDMRPCCWLQDALDNLESNLKPFLNKAPRELEQNVSLQSATINPRCMKGQVCSCRQSALPPCSFQPWSVQSCMACWRKPMLHCLPCTFRHRGPTLRTTPLPRKR